MISDRQDSSPIYDESNRLSAVICETGVAVDQPSEDYIEDCLRALGIEVIRCRRDELLNTITDSNAKILALGLSNSPLDMIDVAKLAIEHCPSICHIKFFQSTQTDLTVQDRIAIAELGIGYLYDTDTSFVKIWNDIKYHIQEVDPAGMSVLLIDDSMTESYETKKCLIEAGFEVDDFICPIEAYEHLNKCIPDIIVVDLHMPEMNGDTFVKLVRQSDKYLGLPVVYLSNETNGYLKNKAVSEGADDFVSKPVDALNFPMHLANRIVRSREQKVQMECDSLTGLLNHTAILNQISLAADSDKLDNIAIIMLDIDHFKLVNDTHGHQVGDKVIRGISILLTRMLRSGDLIGRFGGEEFLIALPNTSKENANMIMNRILKRFRDIKFDSDDYSEFHCSFSAGISQITSSNEIDLALSEADKALYQAKELGRSRVVRAANA